MAQIREAKRTGRHWASTRFALQGCNPGEVLGVSWAIVAILCEISALPLTPCNYKGGWRQLSVFLCFTHPRNHTLNCGKDACHTSKNSMNVDNACLNMSTNQLPFASIQSQPGVGCYNSDGQLSIVLQVEFQEPPFCSVDSAWSNRLVPGDTSIMI